MLLTSGDERALALLPAIVSYSALSRNIAADDDDDDDDDARGDDSTLGSRDVVSALRYASPALRAVLCGVCTLFDTDNATIVHQTIVDKYGRQHNKALATKLVAAWTTHRFDVADDVYERAAACLSSASFVFSKTNDDSLRQKAAPTPHAGAKQHVVSRTLFLSLARGVMTREERKQVCILFLLSSLLSLLLLLLLLLIIDFCSMILKWSSRTAAWRSIFSKY
jgi:hypothetical protein